jgi:hypothetical protein
MYQTAAASTDLYFVFDYLSYKLYFPEQQFAAVASYIPAIRITHSRNTATL